MSQSQDRWVLGATILSESAWLFAVFGVLGATLGLDGSPMRWPSLLVIMGVATLLARLRPSFIAAFAVLSVGAIAAGSVDGLIRWPSLLTAVVIASMLAYRRPIKAASAEVMYLLRFVVGVSVVYFMVASNVTRGVGGFDLSWASIAFFDSAPEGYRLVALIGILMGMALWWRGGSLAGKEFPIESLTFSFRLGVFGLAIATALDILHPADLDTFPMIFIFFAAGLGGLSVGHLLPETKESAKARTWPKVIGGVVTSVLGAGLVFSFLQRDILGYLSRPALSMLDSVVNGVFWGLVIPISAACTVFVNAVLSIFDTAFGGMRDSAGNRRLNETVEQRAADAERAEEDGAMLDAVIQVLEWIVLAIIIVVLLYVLYRFLRKLLGRGPVDTVGQRDSLREDTHLVSDATRLLLKLVPSWVNRRGHKKGFNIPDGHPGVADVLRVYYALLTAAEDMGYRRHHHQTPREFQLTLEGLFPGRLVRMATRAFVNAFYGNHPASDEQIAEMRSSVKGLTTGLYGVQSTGSSPDADFHST